MTKKIMINNLEKDHNYYFNSHGLSSVCFNTKPSFKPIKDLKAFPPHSSVLCDGMNHLGCVNVNVA